MSEESDAPEFLARRTAARQRLDAIDPHKKPGGVTADPYRRHWFEAVYDLAEDDPANVPWADLAPHPLLADWLEHNDVAGLRALDVGCGLGDNAEEIARAGADTTAFDLSMKAIQWARRRFPNKDVAYRNGDLFAPDREWLSAFDFVHECYTLQALPSAVLPKAAEALRSLVIPGGLLLVIARARDEGEAPAGPPWPLARSQIEAIAGAKMATVAIEDIADFPGLGRHWRALFRRVA